MRALYTGIDGVAVDTTYAASLPSSGVDETSGDGIVITQGDADNDPAVFEADINGNTVTDPERAGIVLDGVTVLSCLGNTLSGYGYPDDGSPSIIVQGETKMPEGDADPWTTLTTGALRVNALSLELDDLTQ